jgi:NhaA family Na+:H+ antiporter
MSKGINFIREYSIPLIAGVIVALFWANIHPESYETVIYKEIIVGLNFHFFVQDIFMAFFFAIAAVEITQSFLPGGDLNPIKKAVNPLMATFGGVLGPIGFFFLFNALFGSPEYSHGWAIPTATDIALAWLLARFVFGNKHPAVYFLLLLAVVDDGIGLAIIAIFYPNPLMPFQPIWLLLTLLGIAVAYLLRRFKVNNYWPYLIFGGSLSWFGLYNASLHPALALVAIIPFLPHHCEPDGHVFEDTGKGSSPLKHFEHQWKGFVDFGLFFFGLANAGVLFSEIGALTWIILSALIIGKVVGISTFSLIGSKIGFPLPDGMGRKELITASVVAAMGLTVALFVSDVAFTDLTLKGAAKMGALFSAGIFVVALIVGRLYKIKKIN